jgi:hypothetical protein
MEETPSVMPGKVQAIVIMHRVRLCLLVEFLGSAHIFIRASINPNIVEV